jgi:ribosome-associated protein
LKFNVLSSPNLNDGVKSRLKILSGQRWTKDGFLVIHVDKHRSQARNRDLARLRLSELVKKALILPKTRIDTRPTRIANKKRLDEKTKRGRIKVLRKYVQED